MFFSGEIFNKEEMGLRDMTDAEALARLFRRDGAKGLARVRGSFAFAIDIGGKTILARDQFGLVPLYYYNPTASGAKPLVSTSVRELLEAGVPRKLSHEGLFAYLAYGCLYAPYTMVDCVRIVPPGSIVSIENGNETCERYWTPSFEVKEWSESALQEAVNEKLALSVREQVAAPLSSAPDTTPAAFLSGGIDSSTIVSTWRKVYDGDIRTYCVTHEDPDTDERKWSRMVAERNHTRHTELMLEDGMIRKWLDEAVASYDQPSVDGLNFWFATKLLKTYTDEKLVFSGEGGDELFMGYGQFLKQRLAYRHTPLMRHVPKALGAALNACAPNEKVRKLAVLAGFKGDPYYVPRRVLNDWQIAAFVKPEFIKGIADFDDLALTPHPEAPKDLLNRISWLEMQTVTADMWMRDGYQTSAHNGIAIRTPICDIRLAEMLYTAPGEMKCDAKISKPLLVRAAGEGMPLECAMRRKQGFALPFDRYFAGELKERLDDFLAGGKCALFKPKSVVSLGRQYRAGKVNWARVWTLFMVEDWCVRNKVAP